MCCAAVSGAQQRSGDNAAAAAANADVISSGAVAADGIARRSSSGLNAGRSGGAAGGLHGTAAAAAAAAAAAGGSGGSRGGTGSGQMQQRGGSFRSGGGVGPGEQEAISQEDDSEPVTKGASSGKGGRSGSGGRKSGSVLGAAGAAMLGVTGGEGGAEAEGEGPPGAMGDTEQLGDADEVDYEGLMSGRRSDGGVGDEGGDPVGLCAPIMPRRVRHVPRQSSAINLGTRVGPAEMKRMAAELDSLKGENQLLQMQLQRMQHMQAGPQQQQQQHAAPGGRETGQCSPHAELSAAGAAGGGAGGSSGTRLDALEREMNVLKQQVGCAGVGFFKLQACMEHAACASQLELLVDIFVSGVGSLRVLRQACGAHAHHAVCLLAHLAAKTGLDLCAEASLPDVWACLFAVVSAVLLLLLLLPAAW